MYIYKLIIIILKNVFCINYKKQYILSFWFWWFHAEKKLNELTSEDGGNEGRRTSLPWAQGRPRSKRRKRWTRRRALCHLSSLPFQGQLTAPSPTTPQPTLQPKKKQIYYSERRSFLVFYSLWKYKHESRTE